MDSPSSDFLQIGGGGDRNSKPVLPLECDASPLISGMLSVGNPKQSFGLNQGRSTCLPSFIPFGLLCRETIIDYIKKARGKGVP